ncbi:MAG: protein kinase [Lachnospiraceae bacterium]|nr:protein kinase [Lachnospiraceae bacterium]
MGIMSDDDNKTLMLFDENNEHDSKKQESWSQYPSTSSGYKKKEAIQRELYHLKEGATLSLGRYEIRDVIGFGGFGMTYSAIDHTLEKKVAIKEYYPASLVNRVADTNRVEVFSPKRESEFKKGLDRFLGEARNLAKFANVPNIVSVYNFFEENGTAYLVMEYLDGMTLKEYTAAKGGRLDCELAVRITRDVIAALKVLHKQSILHRDISPDNIFVCKDGVIKLIDFGAARFSANPEEEKTLSVVLKPGFAPPEQYRSKGKQGPWTDIYALGATLYRTITGMVPEESVNRTAKDELKEPKAVYPVIPDYLSKIIMKCMALQPQIRFQNVADLEISLVKKKKVASVKGEILRRRIIRAVIVAAFVAILGIAGIREFMAIKKNQNKATLVPCSIEVWCPIPEGMTQEDIEKDFSDSGEEFSETYPAVSVNVTYIPEREYADQIRNAAAAGNMPNVFEASMLDSYENISFADLSDTYAMLNESDYKIGGFQTLYNSCQIPVGFDMAVLYENTTVSGKTPENDKQGFLNGKSKYYVGTVADYPEIQRQLAGVYGVSKVDSPKVGLCHVWAALSTQEDVTNASVRYLYYLMSQHAQDTLFLEGDQGLPLYKPTFDTYLELNPDLAFLKEETVSADENSVYGILDSDLEEIYSGLK